MGRLAAAVQGDGVPTAIFLADNGVLGARQGAQSAVEEWLQAGVSVAADRFALAERGIPDTDLMPGVAPADLELVLDRLVFGASVIWR